MIMSRNIDIKNNYIFCFRTNSGDLIFLIAYKRKKTHK